MSSCSTGEKKHTVIGACDPDLVVSTGPDRKNLPKTPATHDLVFQLKNGGATKPLTIAGVTITGSDAAYHSVQHG